MPVKWFQEGGGAAAAAVEGAELQMIVVFVAGASKFVYLFWQKVLC